MPTVGEITRIEARAEEIAGYERAAIRATDLLLAKNPDRSKMGVYLAVHRDKAWTVYFGKLSADRKRFTTAYAYSCPDTPRQSSTRPGRASRRLDRAFEEMKAIKVQAAASGGLVELARAIELAVKSISESEEAKSRRYNTNVFREGDGSITVYVAPGNTKPGVALLGGDWKISISSDGRKVLKKTQLHKSVLEFPLKAPKTGERLGMSVHTHVLHVPPTETDVALVLLNPQLAPHYVVRRPWIFCIDAKGKISVVVGPHPLPDVQSGTGGAGRKLPGARGQGK